MGTSSPTSSIVINVKLLLVLIVNVGLFRLVSSGNFTEDFDVTWGGNDRAKILNDGEIITLSLDKESGSGFESKNEYLFGNIHMKVKLVSGDSAGTVTAYYLWSNGSKWDELDFGFFGNRSGEPYILHTNVVTQGEGNREQQFYLWFDPTAEFHIYSILWNPQRIIFAVDGTPIRIFRNFESEPDQEIPYPTKQPMRLYCSIFSAEGLANSSDVETDWSQAPFLVSFADFDADESCPLSSGDSISSSCNNSSSAWLTEDIDLATIERVRWVQNNYMIYNYCSDTDRFSEDLPPECDIDY